jgi:hypothetical protein
MFIVILFALFIASITQAQPTQTKGDVYPVISISPLAGVNFPLQDLNNTYSTSFNAGLDLNLKVNRETSFFLDGAYFNMPAKDASFGPNASVIAITAGPRYIFTSASIKAQIFIEAGLGLYIFASKDFNTNTTPIVVIPGVSTTNFGLNVGPGAIIPLGKSMDLIMKVKIHDMFLKGGSQSFLTAQMGLDFKL